MSPFLTVKPAAEFVGLKPKTLYNMKSAGVGPKAYKNGRITIYYEADLREWLEKRLVKA